MPEEKSPGSLYSRTLELLHASGKSLPLIYKETDIPFYWLRKFSSGTIPDPSVNRVQRLYEYLVGKKLEV